MENTQTQKITVFNSLIIIMVCCYMHHGGHIISSTFYEANFNELFSLSLLSIGEESWLNHFFQLEKQYFVIG